MSFRSLTAAVAMYRGGALSLGEAAERARVTEGRFAAALQARGIRIRADEDGLDPAAG